MFLLLPDIKVWMPETTRGLLPHNVVWFFKEGNVEFMCIPIEIQVAEISKKNKNL